MTKSFTFRLGGNDQERFESLIVQYGSTRKAQEVLLKQPLTDEDAPIPESANESLIAAEAEAKAAAGVRELRERYEAMIKAAAEDRVATKAEKLKDLASRNLWDAWAPNRPKVAPPKWADFYARLMRTAFRVWCGIR